LFGIYYGDDGSRPITATLPASDSLVSANDVIEGHPTVVVSSRGQFGAHTLWLDPGTSYLPRRVRVEKRGRDSFGTRAIDSFQEPNEEGGLQPNSRIVGIVITIDNVRSARVDDHDLIVGYTRQRRYDYADGSTQIWREVFNARDIELNPALASDTFEVS